MPDLTAPPKGRHPQTAEESIIAAHPFDAAIQLDTVDDTTRRGRTHPAWAGMVGPFGGITAATLVRAIETHADRIGEPLALTVNFAAPITHGDYDISLHATRTNRTNQHWILELSQDSAIKTTATALFGTRRDTWGDTETRPPTAPWPEQIAPSNGPRDFVIWGRSTTCDSLKMSLPGPDAQPNPCGTTTLWMRDTARRRVRITPHWLRCMTSAVPACSCARQIRSSRDYLGDDLLPRRSASA